MIKEFKYDNHEEWLEIRSKYIGGSDAGAIIGLNPYKSPYTLWAEKTGKIKPFEGNMTTEVGAYLESFVAELFERESGKKVQRKNATMVNEKYPWACANIDRKVVGENAFLEIKTTNSFSTMKKLKNNEEFPECYYAQCVHYMAVGEYEKCYLAVLINCRELKIFEMSRDEIEIEALMEAEADFWLNHINTGTPPDVDGSESTAETIGELHPESNGLQIDLMGYENTCEMMIAIKKHIKELDKEYEMYSNQIKAVLGDNEKGICAGYQVNYGNQTRTTFDSKKFISEHGNMDFEPYYKTSTTRTFSVKEKKK